MSAYRIVGGDVGTIILFTVREWPAGTDPVPNQLAPTLDISAATNLKLVLIPPEGVKSQGQEQNTVTASFNTNGADGVLKYTTVSGDVPDVPWRGQSQTWQVRPQFTLAGWSGKGEPDSFFVDP